MNITQTIGKIENGELKDSEWEDVYNLIYENFRKKASSLSVSDVCIYLLKISEKENK